MKMILRSLMMLVLGLIVAQMAKRFLQNVEAQKARVKAKADQALKGTRLKLDPVTGVYKPEA
jgi:membrane protein implicated in regulation of membrane protease activity